MYVSNSGLETQAVCELKAFIRYRMGLQARGEVKNQYLVAGSAVHAALACYLVGKPVEECVGEIERVYGDNPDVDTRFEAYEVGAVGLVFKQWALTHPYETLPFRVLDVEVEYDVPFCTTIGGEPIRFKGIFDGLVEDKKTGLVYVLEHKTAGKGKVGAQWLNSFGSKAQVSGYIFISQRIGKPAAGVILNALEIALPPMSSRNCKEHGTKYAVCGPAHLKSGFYGPFTRTEKQIQDWYDTAAHLARRMYQNDSVESNMMTLPTKGIFTNSCGWCEFSKFCQAGRPMHMIPQLFEPLKKRT